MAVLPSNSRANPMMCKRFSIMRFRRYRQTYRQRGATLPGLDLPCGVQRGGSPARLFIGRQNQGALFLCVPKLLARC